MQPVRIKVYDQPVIPYNVIPGGSPPVRSPALLSLSLARSLAAAAATTTDGRRQKQNAMMGSVLLRGLFESDPHDSEARGPSASVD